MFEKLNREFILRMNEIACEICRQFMKSRSVMFFLHCQHQWTVLFCDAQEYLGLGVKEIYFG
jgi:hypothetical protein